MSTKEGIMTVKEVAEYLRVSEATVYNLAKQRTIPAVKFGRVWRFKKEDIERLFDESVDRVLATLEKSPIETLEKV